MSLAAQASPLREARQHREVAAQTPAGGTGRGVPVRIRLPEVAAQVEGGDEVVPGGGIEARQEARTRPAEHGDREVAGFRAGVGVAADDRDAVERAASERPARIGSAAPASRLTSASTTASGRPPIAATSLRLTMIPQ